MVPPRALEPTPEVALVGSGLAALTVYAALRQGGLAPERIVVFGTDDDPAGGWRVRAASIRQTHMRSESDGHCLPRTFPGLAAREARRRRSLDPLIYSVLDRYRPSVETFLAHVASVRRRTRWDESFRPRRIGRVQVVEDGFLLDGDGPFRHVLLAPGHPGLNVPSELNGDPRAVHAYEPHEYADEVAVVGAGMAAATEWRNALAAGSIVTSIRRREPLRRPLNLPRPLFSKRGLATFHRTGRDDRVALLRSFSAPSYPPGREWDEPLARANGRFAVASTLDAADRAAQVICATGFRRGIRSDPLLAALVDDHGVETAADWIVLDSDGTVPALTGPHRTLALAGVPAQWAFPAADTLAGMRYVGHRFLCRCRTR
jgi:cation diffusion facilitator CzcD-associated flavoprotein CzcO